jgi:lipoate-protein ligase A
VSLGHFQAVQSGGAGGAVVPPRFHSLPVVRRLSGGGAILHDQELTYSCVLASGHELTPNPVALYDRIHQAIIDTLAELGVACRMRGDEAFADQSFLCFSRGDARDIVFGGHKIVGSAQRRRQGVILQHGSLLLSRSVCAEEFPGIAELSGVSLSAPQLIPLLRPRILEPLQLTGRAAGQSLGQSAGLTPAEQARVQAITPACAVPVSQATLPVSKTTSS